MIYFNIFFGALNLFCFYTFQTNPLYTRGFNLACCLIASLLVIVDVIEKKKLSVKTINKDFSKPGIEIEKHGSYYYKETCPICGCIFHYTPNELGFSYDNIGEENETGTEWIYCPECAHKFEWNEGYHKKLNY